MGRPNRGASKATWLGAAALVLLWPLLWVTALTGVALPADRMLRALAPDAGTQHLAPLPRIDPVDEPDHPGRSVAAGVCSAPSCPPAGSRI